MNTDETRPDSVGNVEVVPSATEQVAPTQPTRAFVACKRIVPPLSTLAFLFLTTDWARVLDTVGGGGHGGGGHH